MNAFFKLIQSKNKLEKLIDKSGLLTNN